MPAVRPLFLSAFPPETCGLADFTRDCADAVDLAAREPVSSVVAIRRTPDVVQTDPRVAHVVDNDRPDGYREAAEIANSGSCDVVSLQHEFGLFAGEWGSRVLHFAHHCRKPLVTTFHTLPSRPTPQPRRIIQNLADRSHAVVVMTKFAARLLSSAYGVNGARVHVIPHGAPVVPFDRNSRLKAHLGLAGRRVICSFGPLDRGKGLETMIAAMPQIVAACSDAVYLILGATDPQTLRREGDAYRESLTAMAVSLGVGRSVRFVDRHLPLHELLEHLRACDLCVTPDTEEDQVSSGTLACALAAVGAVVSTPYLYAEEVLARERGLLVPFCDSAAMARASLRYLTDLAFRNAARRRAFEYARAVSWPNVGRQCFRLYSELVPEPRDGRSPLFPMAPLAAINGGRRSKLFSERQP